MGSFTKASISLILFIELSDSISKGFNYTIELSFERVVIHSVKYSSYDTWMKTSILDVSDSVISLPAYYKGLGWIFYNFINKFHVMEMWKEIVILPPCGSCHIWFYTFSKKSLRVYNAKIH